MKVNLLKDIAEFVNESILGGG
ncbi:hypothetical protein XBFFL1_1600029 [Xenorhabdus bovienii str. feltiae Florida]|uniref:Uncharacterized protein n=1 Tax=Xenorhabdus bovienii str. kraussei Becker Underwood TaxID=1398204 RepID=A0A077PSE4_XENBV|nr:hypothetical protein XBFFR1_1250033 [Xenorhabdus bovienii str. feltiae France]CDG91436.1 hypothetical protein XBFFL1_1600029 [Xenorhabdus bovienii str. feltiae Florida]CDH23973.1 hypothetical protein XBKB1_2280003 [Xenorhabdus bovienii str. kraussei Becker Underwood]